MSWGDARSFCKDNQSTSDLVTIKSPYENNYIKKIAKNQQTRLWIGLTDSLAEGSWQWIDDTNTNSWSNWAQGEPNGDRRENCGNILDFLCMYVFMYVTEATQFCVTAGSTLIFKSVQSRESS